MRQPFLFSTGYWLLATAFLVASGVVERGFDGLALDLVHRGGHVYLKCDGASLAGGLGALAAKARAVFEDVPADRFGKVCQLDLAARGDDDGALDGVLQLAHVARPVVRVERLKGLARDAGDEAAGLLLV